MNLFKIIALALTTVCLSFQSAWAKMEIGYNEAWFGGNYGTGLTSSFDYKSIQKTLSDIKSAGGSIVRVWLFENRQGLILARYAPQTQGIEAGMLTNLVSLFNLAKEKNLRVYITLFDGNNMPDEKGELRDYYYNLLNNKYGEADAFNKNVLTPLLKILNEHWDIIYGLDLINEIQAPRARTYWGFYSHDKARLWIRKERDFIKSQSPWLKITASAGWASAAKDISTGFYSDLKLDFYDLHVYDNHGLITGMYDVCERAKKDGVPVILGEFGQFSKTNDDKLQYRSTEGFLKNAKKACFTAALAWRFDSQENYWGYQRKDGSFRPAVELMRQYSKQYRE